MNREYNFVRLQTRERKSYSAETAFKRLNMNENVIAPEDQKFNALLRKAMVLFGQQEEQNRDRRGDDVGDNVTFDDSESSTHKAKDDNVLNRWKVDVIFLLVITFILLWFVTLPLYQPGSFPALTQIMGSKDRTDILEQMDEQAATESFVSRRLPETKGLENLSDATDKVQDLERSRGDMETKQEQIHVEDKIQTSSIHKLTNKQDGTDSAKRWFGTKNKKTEESNVGVETESTVIDETEKHWEKPKSAFAKLAIEPEKAIFGDIRRVLDIGAVVSATFAALSVATTMLSYIMAVVPLPLQLVAVWMFVSFSS